VDSQETIVTVLLEAQLDGAGAVPVGAALARDIAAALTSEELRVPTFCLIAKKVLQRRLAGQDDPEIAAWLVERVGITARHTRTILGMATDAGRAAADIDDGADFDEVVDHITKGVLSERPFVVAMVQMAIDLMKSEGARLDRSDLAAGLMARMRIDEATIAGSLRIVRGVLARHASGATDLAAHVAEETGMNETTAHAFVEQALNAGRAALRLRQGEDLPIVFREANLDRAAPQLVILALRLADERD
jgi:hypothetical protein